MSRKLFSLIACLVLVLGFGVVPGSAQEEEGGEFVIRPTRINPPDGSVDIYVPLGDSIIIRTGWAACTRGLAQAWTKQNKISLWVNGESMFSSPDEARLFWSDPESYPFPSESSCVNDQESGWAVYWEYPLGELAEGTYTIHYEENVDHPFLDGGDYDGDGKPDIDEWHISVDFNIIVTEMGSISGIVTEEGTGEPIEGMVVDVCDYDAGWDGPCFSAWTEADGSYFIPGIPVGTYRVFSGWDDSNWVVEYYNEQELWALATPVEVEANTELSGVNFTLVLGGSISGTVTEQESGAPLANAWVEACDYENGWPSCFYGETDVDGNYFIPSVPDGSYRVAAYLDWNWVEEFYSEQAYRDFADFVVVEVDTETSGINFTLEKGGAISGTVTDQETSTPLAGAWVEACDYENGWPFCFYAETEADGSYSIPHLPVGTYRVNAYLEGNWVEEFYSEQINWDFADAVNVVADVNTPNIDFTLEMGGSISGLVTDGDGNPLANIGVDIMDGGYGNCTDENGYYSIMGLPFGTYDIVAGRDFCGPHPYVEDVKYGITINGVTPDVDGYNFELTIGGSISGTVTTVDGEGNTVPVIGLWVDACHESVSLDKWGNSPLCNGAETNQGGFYTITHLLPGNYRIVTWGTEELSLQFYDGVLNYYEASLVTVEPGQIRDEVDFSLFVSGPAFNAWPIEDYIDGWGWDEEVPVTLTIDNPSNGIGTDYTITLSPFPDTTLVMFELQGVFDLDPGYIVTLDNGIHTKQHTVTKLAIAGTDLATSSVFGTAEPGSHVYVWYYTDEGRIDRHEVAGASGSWTANFSMPGDEPGEEQTYMIPAGAGGEANQVDFDGDGTQVNWWMQEP